MGPHNAPETETTMMPILPLLTAAFALAVESAAPQGTTTTPPTTTPVETRPPTPEGFGYNAFRSSTGEITSGPVDEEYLLSPGDEVAISIWGALNETMNLVVSEDGFLELPEGGGRIQTNGVALRQLREVIVRALSQIHAAYINAATPAASTAFVDVRLGKIRPILVYVVGEVEKPGAYGMSAAVANLVNAITNAGGVTPAGTLREVKLRRSNGSVDSIDLYDFVLSGALDFQKTRIRPGDYIIVPLKAKSVRIEGEVRRPMGYELIGDEGVRELLEFAGGATPSAYLKQVQLRRSVPSVGQIVLDIDLAALLSTPDGDFPLQDGDVLTVGRSVQVRRPVVSISGDGITRPGTYEWKRGMRLSDLIAKGEGLREHALLERADLIRTDDSFVKRLQIFSLAGLYEKGAEGELSRSSQQDGDFELREMDEVLVQSTWGLAGKDKAITLEGHVKHPGTAALAQGMTLYDILFTHGGFQDPSWSRGAFMGLAHLKRKIPGVVGTRTIAFDLGALLAKDPSANIPLEDGDVVRIHAFADLVGRPVVTINGLVNRGGTFEFSEGMSLEDLILLAGGLDSRATKPEAVIARSVRTGGDDSSKQAITVELDRDLHNRDHRTELFPDDRVTIRHQLGWEPHSVATVRGEVNHPGSFPMPREGFRLSDLVVAAGGLQREALPAGAVLMRQGGMVGGAAPVEKILTTINLDAALETPGGAADLELLDGDELIIPKNTGLVIINGAVNRPLAVQFQSSSTLADYLALCGGLLPNADRERITIQSPNLATHIVQPDETPMIIPGSVIEVPLQRESERILRVEVKGAVAAPAIVQFTDDAPLGFYIGMCGGFTASADLERVVVILPDGGLLTGQLGDSFNPVIPPGSIVVVTARPIEEKK